jgi:murein DD-endopeptidase MepM/ murein hydrolase activator NlpD
MRNDTVNKPHWDPAILLVGLLLFLSSLACDGIGSRVQPDHPDLPLPTSNAGMEMARFLESIGAFPQDSIPPPWIVQPINGSSTTATEIEVTGWAVNATDRPALNASGIAPQLVVYGVDSSVSPPTLRGEVGRVDVADSRHWAVGEISLSDGPNAFVARVFVAGHASNWSNVVQVHRVENLPEVTIDSPSNGTAFPLGTWTVPAAGRAPEQSTVTLFRRSHSSTGEPTAICLGSTRADADGRWQIDTVAIVAGENTWFARAPGGVGDTLQSEDIRIRREALLWPIADPATHNRISQWYTSAHTGLDIALGSDTPDVVAAASGSVTVRVYCVPKDTELETTFSPCATRLINLQADEVAGCQTASGTSDPLYVGYGLCVIVTHDGVWQGYRTLYAHLGSVAVATGAHVTAGATIGVADSTGCSTGNHLHFEVQRQDEKGSWLRVNLNPRWEIPNKFCRTDASPGEDLLEFDWQASEVILRAVPNKSCTLDTACPQGERQ